MTADRERAVNRRQVGELLGLAPITLQQMAARGDGPPFFKMGRSVRYRLGDVLDWREARTVGFRSVAIMAQAPESAAQDPRRRLAPGKPGFVYAVNLIPESTPYRIKIGYTEGKPHQRLAAFFITCPTAALIGYWSAARADEGRVHASLRRSRIGDSEVFAVDDLEACLDQVDRVFAEART